MQLTPELAQRIETMVTERVSIYRGSYQARCEMTLPNGLVVTVSGTIDRERVAYSRQIHTWEIEAMTESSFAFFVDRCAIELERPLVEYLRANPALALRPSRGLNYGYADMQVSIGGVPFPSVTSIDYAGSAAWNVYNTLINTTDKEIAKAIIGEPEPQRATRYERLKTELAG
jgi:hypothetical protein